MTLSVVRLSYYKRPTGIQRDIHENELDAAIFSILPGLVTSGLEQMSGTSIVYLLLGATIAVGCVASLSIRPELRGWRNLAILVSLLLGVISPFVAGWQTALVVWSTCALVAAVAYHVYEFWTARTHPLEDGAEAEPGQSILVTFMHALFLWPLLVFDTFENTCAELFPSMLLDPQAMAAAKVLQPDVTERNASEFAARRRGTGSIPET